VKRSRVGRPPDERRRDGERPPSKSDRRDSAVARDAAGARSFIARPTAGIATPCASLRRKTAATPPAPIGSAMSAKPAVEAAATAASGDGTRSASLAPAAVASWNAT